MAAMFNVPLMVCTVIVMSLLSVAITYEQSFRDIEFRVRAFRKPCTLKLDILLCNKLSQLWSFCVHVMQTFAENKTEEEQGAPSPTTFHLRTVEVT